MVRKIISGGETGVDRAARDAARHCGIEHGGAVTKGRRAENGELHPSYQTEELDTVSYPARTEKNVLDSDGTLIISHGKLTGGSALTRKLVKTYKKPWLHVDLDKIEHGDALQMIRGWIDRNNIEVLNVAGPRVSKAPPVYNETVDLICTVLGFYPPVEPKVMFITEPSAFYPACWVSH